MRRTKWIQRVFCVPREIHNGLGLVECTAAGNFACTPSYDAEKVWRAGLGRDGADRRLGV